MRLVKHRARNGLVFYGLTLWALSCWERLKSSAKVSSQRLHLNLALEFCGNKKRLNRRPSRNPDSNKNKTSLKTNLMDFPYMIVPVSGRKEPFVADRAVGRLPGAGGFVIHCSTCRSLKSRTKELSTEFRKLFTPVVVFEIERLPQENEKQRNN